MDRPYNFELAELLDQHFVAPQCFEPDEVFDGQLDRYKAEIEDLFADANDPKTKLVTAGALARIDQSNDELVLPVLIAGLEGDDKTQLAFAASCLVLGPLSLPAMPLLIGLLRHEDEYVAYEAAKAHGRIGAESIPHLIAALDCVTTGVGDAAAIALGDMGPVAVDALPALRKCLNLDGSYWEKGLRLMAADAIWHIVGDNTHVLAIAGEMLDDDDCELCARACVVLADQGDAAQPYADKLEELMTNGDQWVRQEAARALVRCWFN